MADKAAKDVQGYYGFQGVSASANYITNTDLFDLERDLPDDLLSETSPQRGQQNGAFDPELHLDVQHQQQLSCYSIQQQGNQSRLGTGTNVTVVNPFCVVTRPQSGMSRMASIQGQSSESGFPIGHRDIGMAQQAQSPVPSPPQFHSGAPIIGQAVPQQATQRQSTVGNQQSGTPSITVHPERQRLFQQQLKLLLHAEKCLISESHSNGEPCGYILQHCQTIKNVLKHMATCYDDKKCRAPHCSSSRLIMAHWNSCKRSDCPICGVCLPLRSDAENSAGAANQWQQVNKQQEKQQAQQPQKQQPTPSASHVRRTHHTTTPDLMLGHGVTIKGSDITGPTATMTMGGGFFQFQQQNVPYQSLSGSNQQVVVPNVSLPFSSNQTTMFPGVGNNQQFTTTGPTIFSNIQQSVSEMQQSSLLNQNRLSNLQSAGRLQPNQRTATVVHGTKDWHLTPDFRRQHVHELVQAIFPVPAPQAMVDGRIRNLWNYAERVEDDMYERANSRSEYYQLLAEKIANIQKDRPRRRQGAMQPVFLQKHQSILKTATGGNVKTCAKPRNSPLSRLEVKS